MPGLVRGPMGWVGRRACHTGGLYYWSRRVTGASASVPHDSRSSCPLHAEHFGCTKTGLAVRGCHFISVMSPLAQKPSSRASCNHSSAVGVCRPHLTRPDETTTGRSFARFRHSGPPRRGAGRNPGNFAGLLRRDSGYSSSASPQQPRAPATTKLRAFVNRALVSQR